MGQIDDAVRKLTRALEVSMYYGVPDHEVGIRGALAKLGIKSAYTAYDSRHILEGISATLNQVTFEDTHLQRWKTDGGK